MTPVAYNTQYYRNNKTTKNIIHKCPHCNYSTTGAKVIIRNHVWAKHTEEKDRPFQCPHTNCSRGFAQKILLQRHLKKIHNQSVILTIDRKIAEFHVKVGRYVPASNATKNRVKYYLSKRKGILYPSDLTNYEFLPNKKINKNHIYYDAREGYIELKTFNPTQLKNKVSPS